MEGEADIGVAVDDSEVADPGSEPVSSRLRSRGRAARAAHSNQGSHAEECAHVVEKSYQPALPPQPALHTQPALSCHDRELFTAGTDHLAIGSCRTCSCLELSTMSGKCNCTCILVAYSSLATILVIGLAAILGHQSTGDTCKVDPTIMDNAGQVAVSEETVYNIDVFNSHAVTENTEDKGEGGCETSCAHYFTGLQVGELISFILLACLFVYNWGQISLWCHSQCKEFRKSARATKNAKNEKKRQTLKRELEAELAAKAEAGSCSGMPNQTV